MKTRSLTAPGAQAPHLARVVPEERTRSATAHCLVEIAVVAGAILLIGCYFDSVNWAGEFTSTRR